MIILYSHNLLKRNSIAHINNEIFFAQYKKYNLLKHSKKYFNYALNMRTVAKDIWR